MENQTEVIKYNSARVMKVLLLNQCFYPDVMATAQQLTDLAIGLTNEGHEVTVITSDRGYDDPSRRFPHREVWNGISIIRIRSLALGKSARWRRVVSFASFLLSCSIRLLTQPRFDVVVALTSPPLISFLGSAFVKLKGGEFFFWVMDLNPDEAIAAGWLREGSLTSKISERLLRYSLVRAKGIIALDHFMKSRIVAKGILEEKVTVLPPWALDETVAYDPAGRQAFRRENNLEDSFVVMYAGNHSPCHPLDTLLEAARRLADQTELVFCFVGGGSEQLKVKEFAVLHKLENIHCFPYQPFDKLSGSLSAADLHAVVMGNEFVGIVHPSKLYNILAIGSPFLYVGPEQSHINEIATQIRDQYRSYTARHGEVETVVECIREAAGSHSNGVRTPVPEIAAKFSRKALLPRLVKLLESRSEVDSVDSVDSQVSGRREPSKYASAIR